MVWDPIRSSPGSGIAFPEAPAEARKTQKSLKKLVRSTKVTKPKLRGSWGGKLEAEAVLGVAKPTVRRASGSTWGRPGVGLGYSGRVLGGPGGQGRAPEKFLGRFVNKILGRNKYEHLSKKSFPSSSAETSAE